MIADWTILKALDREIGDLMSTSKDIQCFIIIDSNFRPRIKSELLERLAQNGISLKNANTLEFDISDLDLMKQIINECIEDKVVSSNEISIDSY